MYRERIAHIIKTLESVERRNREQKHSHFDMGQWATDKKRECGTVACAAGWECLTRYAQDRGLRLKQKVLLPYYKPTDAYGMEAMADYLDIDESLADILFSPSSYKSIFRFDKITPRHVMKRLKWLLNATESEVADAVENRSYWVLPGWLGVVEHR